MITLDLILPYSGDVSVNRYCRHKKDGGVYIQESARLWGLFVRAGLNSLLPNDFQKEWLDETHPFDLDVFVAFPRQFSTRSGDAGNFDKWPRDVVAECLGVDDAGTIGKHDGSYGNKDQAHIELFVHLHLKPEFVQRFDGKTLQYKWSN